jgi:hypothetical protein
MKSPATANKGGRPLTGSSRGRKVTLYMLPADEAKAKQIGAGNVSLGVRIALQLAADRNKASKP